MADNTEFRQNLIREWRAALDAVRLAGAVTITVGVTDMAIILDAADTPRGEQPRTTEDRLYGKYYVRRADGREKPDADYFVLNIASDREAQTAALAFADACENNRPGLAGDLRSRVAAYRTPTTRTES